MAIDIIILLNEGGIQGCNCKRKGTKGIQTFAHFVCYCS